MIRPGDHITPQMFMRIWREQQRRSKIWVAPPLQVSNVASGVMLTLQQQPAPPAPVSTIMARIQRPSNTYTDGWDFIEVEFDEVRRDWLPKPNGRNTIATAPHIPTDKVAYEINNSPLATGSFAGFVNPIDQVAVLSAVLNPDNTTSGVWWFESFLPREKSIIQPDAAIANDTAFIPSPGLGPCCGGTIPPTLTAVSATYGSATLTGHICTANSDVEWYGRDSSGRCVGLIIDNASCSAVLAWCCKPGNPCAIMAGCSDGSSDIEPCQDPDGQQCYWIVQLFGTDYTCTPFSLNVPTNFWGGNPCLGANQCNNPGDTTVS